ncbi:hypothetical protein J7E62_20335 [Variovorax paradoxus]|nr:hypothetical protein [Variovorax paradoxus]
MASLRPVSRKNFLFDPIESGGLTEPDRQGETTRMPLLPLTAGGRRPGVKCRVAHVDRDTQEVLQRSATQRCRSAGCRSAQ